MKDFFLGFGVLAFIAFIILSPFVTIWALNTLFPALAIPYNIETYVATMVLNSFAIRYKKD
jgi:hypothetical protein